MVGLDFIGEINPNYFGPHRWILTTTDYFTKWIEAIPTRRDTDVVIMDLWKIIFCQGLDGLRDL